MYITAIMTKTTTGHILIDPSDERRILDFRPLGFRDVVVLGRYSYAAVHQALEEHCHGDMVEICYLECGEQTYFVGPQRFDLTGGDAFVTFPGEKHGSGPSPEGKGLLFWMLLHLPGPRRRCIRVAFERNEQLPKILERSGIVLVASPQRVFVELDMLFGHSPVDRAAQPAIAERIHG
jgi:hypothetical protein